MNDYLSLLNKVYTEGQEVGPRGLKTKELLGVTLEIDGYNFMANPKFRPFSEVSKYLFAELSWYFSGERNIKNILPYSKMWGNIRNADNTANSNYGDLVFYRKNSQGITSFDWAYERLWEDKETRKAIVLYNDRELFYRDNKDLICNQYQHFLIRNNELICFLGLRSSDAIYGLSFNMPWWAVVHQQLYLMLKRFYPELRLGKITAFISSSHIYENKWGLVEKILASQNEKYFIKINDTIPLGGSFSWYEKNLPMLISAVKLE